MSALDGLDAVIFDLDGVVTRTAKVHARAWKEAFAPVPFDPVDDYLKYADGKPRPDGVRTAVVTASRNGEAGRAGGFAEVIGVDRAEQAAALRGRGATRVVRDLAELNPGPDRGVPQA